MVVEFTTAYATIAYHHWCCEFESQSGRARCTTLYDKVCQWLATCWWFSAGPPVSSTNKTDRQHIIEILLKVALNTIKQTYNIYKLTANVVKRKEECVLEKGLCDRKGRQRTTPYAKKRYDFNFHIVNFPFICSNKSATPLDGLSISHLIHYSRTSYSYYDFLDRSQLLSRTHFLDKGLPLSMTLLNYMGF